MDDTELDLIAQLSFVRSDLEQFVFAVLRSMNPAFHAVVWPAGEADLGRHLVMLGRALQWHAAARTPSPTAENRRPDPSHESPDDL
jgi:hypothetical protein